MSVFVEIEKKLGDFHLKIAFEAGNETLALLGASGCGKSLTLKCIAGIEKPDKGRIVLDDVVLFDSEKGIDMPAQQRQVGLMFQNYALFPNMTVLQNVMAGARREKNKLVRQEAVDRVIGSFGLTELVSRYPHQLSGGQQQRVALARMLVSDPKIILMDEPFSALDSHLRFRVEQEVRSVIQEFGKTVIFVSHDRDEVYRMADIIAVMNDGSIDACGEKHELFRSPKTRTSAMLTGCKNISSVKWLSEHRIYAEDWGIELSVSEHISEAAYVGIRMHDVCIEDNNSEQDENSVLGERRETASGAYVGDNIVHCLIEDEIENPFSYTLMLKPAGSDSCMQIGCEIDRSIWSRKKKRELNVSLPKDKLILLK